VLRLRESPGRSCQSRLIPEISANHSSTGCHGWPLKRSRIWPEPLGRALNSSGFGEAPGAVGRWIDLTVSFVFPSSGLPDGWPGVSALPGDSPGLPGLPGTAMAVGGTTAPGFISITVAPPGPTPALMMIWSACLAGSAPCAGNASADSANARPIEPIQRAVAMIRLPVPRVPTHGERRTYATSHDPHST